MQSLIEHYVHDESFRVFQVNEPRIIIKNNQCVQINRLLFSLYDSFSFCINNGKSLPPVMCSFCVCNRCEAEAVIVI